MAVDAEESGSRNKSESWWKQRTSMERSAILLLIIAAVIIIGLIVGLSVVVHRAKTNKSKNQHNLTCLGTTITPGYVEAAANVLRYIDQSADPCEDFYQFACGRFLEETEIPDNKGEVSFISLVSELVEKQLKTIMEEPSRPDDPKPFKMVKTAYSVCMNTTAIEEEDVAPIQKLLEDLGGWPVLDANWSEDGFDWKRVLSTLRQNGLDTDHFFDFEVAVDVRNTSRHVLGIDQTTLDIGRDNLLGGFEDEIVDAYYNYMIDLCVLFGATRELAEEQMKEMMEFRIQLGNISIPDEKRRNFSTMYNLMTIGDLQRNYTSISWLELLNQLVGHPVKKLKYEDQIIVTQPEQLHQVEALLKSTRKRTLANYGILKILRGFQWCLPKRIRNRGQEFIRLIQGVSEPAPRWTECVSIVSDSLHLATGALYVRKYGQEEVRQSAIKVVADIKEELVKMIKRVRWMDRETKNTAIDKALTMTTHVAYADEFLDDAKLEEYYEGLVIDSQNFFELKNKLDKFKLDKTYLALWDAVNQTAWSTRVPPMMVNAVYAPSENSIQIPVGILQETIFGKDKPYYLNYAAIGYIIGHEFTHGFDDQGKQFDKNGNLLNWWAKKTDEAFAKKAECIVEQYRSYIVPELKIPLNGEITQGENIADNGGIKEAYLAYNAWSERNGVEAPLPGLNYTAKQTFWIAAANVWCIKERVEYLDLRVAIDEHSPGRYRVLVPFINSKYFAEDFNCPVGSKMNPKHKCEVW